MRSTKEIPAEIRMETTVGVRGRKQQLRFGNEKQLGLGKEVSAGGRKGGNS